MGICIFLNNKAEQKTRHLPSLDNRIWDRKKKLEKLRGEKGNEIKFIEKKDFNFG